MTQKRKVNVYEYDCKGGFPRKKIWVGVGEFRQYGYDYVEFESGPGTFTTAIVEMPDGTVKNITVDLITFIERPEVRKEL